MLREVKSTQCKVRHLYIELDGSAVAGGTLTTDGLTHGQNDVTVTENSSGNYTFFLNTPGQRIVNVQATPITDVTTCRVVAADTDKTKVTIEQVGADQTTPEADADFYLLIVVSDASAET
jgi:hypothetical protein